MRELQEQRIEAATAAEEADEARSQLAQCAARIAEAERAADARTEQATCLPHAPSSHSPVSPPSAGLGPPHHLSPASTPRSRRRRGVGPTPRRARRGFGARRRRPPRGCRASSSGTAASARGGSGRRRSCTRALQPRRRPPTPLRRSSSPSRAHWSASERRPPPARPRGQPLERCARGRHTRRRARALPPGARRGSPSSTAFIPALHPRRRQALRQTR